MDGWKRRTIPERRRVYSAPTDLELLRLAGGDAHLLAGGGGGRQCKERTTMKRRVMGERGREGERVCAETGEEKEEVQRQRRKCMTSE